MPKKGPKDATYENMIHYATGKSVTEIGPDGWVNDIDNDELVSRVMPAQTKPGFMPGGGSPMNLTKVGRGGYKNSRGRGTGG